jgi:predicted dehydrogenase
MYTGLRVIGENGFIEVEWDGGFLKSAVYDEPDWNPEVFEEDQKDVIVAMIKDVVDSYENGTEPEVDYHKGLRATEIIFALYESVRQNSRIELPISIKDNPFITMLEAGSFGEYELKYMKQKKK